MYYSYHIMQLQHTKLIGKALVVNIPQIDLLLYSYKY